MSSKYTLFQFDATGAIVWDRRQRPFGETLSITGTATNNQRFPGQYADAATGLHYNWFRHYDPSLGRYITSDPIGLAAGQSHMSIGGSKIFFWQNIGQALGSILLRGGGFLENQIARQIPYAIALGLAGGLNTYGYAAGNPVMYSDPTGEDYVRKFLNPIIQTIRRTKFGRKALNNLDSAVNKFNSEAYRRWRNFSRDFSQDFFNPDQQKAGNENVCRYDPNGPLWTSTKNKSAAQNAFEHWKNHGSDFPDFLNAKQYVEGARRFLNNPPNGTLTKTRSNGDTLLYNPNTNTFAVMDAKGAPRTMFQPKSGNVYWNNQ